MFMKKRLPTPFLSWLIMTLLLPATALAQPVDGIAAVVNNDVILLSELSGAVQQARAQLGARADNIPADTLRSNTLDQLIFSRLQLQRARELGLAASEEEINAQIARLAQQNKMEVEQFAQALQAQGMSLQELGERIRENVLIQKVREQEVMSTVRVTENDVTEFLASRSLQNKSNREYHLRHIRLDLPLGDSPEAARQVRERLEEIRSQAMSGAAGFAQLAAANSDHASAANGGDMGWINSAAMPQVFVDNISGLSQGGISPVFRSEGAFHLLQLLGSRTPQSLAGGEKVMIDEVRVSHILLQPNALRNQERTHELASDLRARMDAGADFAELAKEYSDDKNSAEEGGDIGWVQPETLDPQATFRIAQMQPGDISPVLETANGYAIIKVVDRRQLDKTREAIRNHAQQLIGQRKAQEKGRRWLQELRAEAYIDIRLDGYQPVGG